MATQIALELIPVIVSLLVLPCTSANINTSTSTHYTSRYELHHMMEAALLRNNQTIYDIQERFLNSKYMAKNKFTYLHFHNTCLTVDKLDCPLNQSSTGFLSGSYHRCWEFQWTDSALIDLISEDIISLLDPISGQIRKTFILLTKGHSIYNLHIHLKRPLCIKENALMDEFLKVLSWVKVYALKSGLQAPTNLDDIGFVSILQGDALNNHRHKHLQHTFRFAITASYMAITALAPLVLWRTLPKVLSRIEIMNTPNIFGHLYWAIGVTILLLYSFNFKQQPDDYIKCSVLHIPDMHRQCSDLLKAMQLSRDMYKDMQAAFIMKATIFPVAILMELVIAIRAWRFKAFPQPPAIVCLLFCCCKQSVRLFITKLLQVIILWLILIFIQLLVSMVIPIAIIVMVGPLYTLSFLSAILVFFILFTLLLAYLLHICNECTHQCNVYSSSTKIQCLKMIFRVPFNMATMSVLAAFILGTLLLYIVMVFAGLTSDGVKGILVSLLPTIILTLIGWFIKRRFFNKHKKSSARRLRRLSTIESGQDDSELSEDTETELI